MQKIHLKYTFCDVTHIKIFLARNENRTSIIQPYLHAVIPIKMNQVGHAFKACMDAHMLQEKALWQCYTIYGFMTTG